MDNNKLLFAIVAVGAIILAAVVILAWTGLDIYRLLGSLLGAFSIVAVLFLGGLASLIIIKMATGAIDLRYLIADEQGDASLSRFQMLLFTFVIAGLYFLYSLYALYAMRNGTACPGNLAATLKDLADAATKAQTAIQGQSVAAPASDQVAALATKAKQASDGLAGICQAFSLPEIPATVLGLIGISGGSYLLSKGISAAAGPTDTSSGANTGTKQWPAR